MKTRLITAAVGVPFLIFTLVVRGWFAEFVIVALTFIAMYENYRALKKAGYAVCEWGGYVATAAMWPLSRLMGVLDPLLLLVAAMGVSMTGVMLHEKPAFPDAAASVYPLLTCFLPMSMFMMMMNSTYGVDVYKRQDLRRGIQAGEREARSAQKEGRRRGEGH